MVIKTINEGGEYVLKIEFILKDVTLLEIIAITSLLIYPHVRLLIYVIVLFILC